MSAVHGIYGILLKQAVYERRAQGSFWITWVLLAAAVPCFLGGAYMGQQWRDGVLLAIVPLGATAFMWWGMLVRSAVAQNQPSHACLVPHLRRRLMVALAAACCTGVLLVAGLASLKIGHFGHLLAALSLVFPFVLLMQRYSWLSILPSVVVFSALSWLKQPLADATRWLAGYDEWAVTLAALAVIVPLSAWALQVTLPRGGDAHSDWYRKYTSRLAALRSGGVKPASDSRALWALLRWRQRPITAGTPVGNKMMAGLGLSVWTTAAVAPLMVAVGWLIMVPLKWSLGARMPEFGTALIEIMAMSSVLICVQSQTTVLSQRRGEQAVLRLAPGLPSAPALNRVLARVMLRRFMAAWGVSAACVLLIEATAAGQPALSGHGLLLAVLPLPFSFFMLRDYATMPRQRDPQQTGVVLGMVVLMVPAGLRLLLPDVWCGVLALVVAVVSLVLLRWRWRYMMRAPVAFPAGRSAP